MTTVTGLTADRMLAIEGASVVDGDVDGSGNLILTKHDGSKINAGSVIGPQGTPGPPGSDVAVVSARQILDVGLPNQIRAGRQLSPADFAAIGLNPPAGLWNLSDLTDASGNGRNLLNKGAVTFGTGINGVATTAAQFTGAAGQALYISDTGANDPFRMYNGSVGCWFKTPQRAAFQMLVDKYGLANNQCWSLYVDNNNVAHAGGSPDGASNIMQITGVSDVADDRWHFAVMTLDTFTFKLYVDGVLEGIFNSGNLFWSKLASPLNIGGRGADAATNAQYPHFGRVDEAFVTPDVLSEAQIRYLYAAKLSHTIGAIPSRASVRVRRRRRGAGFVASDFATQPLRLHNFSAGSMADEGSNNQILTNNAACVPISGSDGAANNAMAFYAPSNQSLSSTDAGLPAGVAARSYGCWFKASMPGAFEGLIGWGTTPTGDARISLNTAGNLRCASGADYFDSWQVVAEGFWHFVVIVEDNASLTNVKRKMYIDGLYQAGSTVLNPVTLAGANKFRIGCAPDGTLPYTGIIDGVFVVGYALTSDQIHALYAKGAQALAPAPKNAGDHIEGLSATDMMVIFDSISTADLVDVSAA